MTDVDAFTEVEREDREAKQQERLNKFLPYALIGAAAIIVLVAGREIFTSLGDVKSSSAASALNAALQTYEAGEGASAFDTVFEEGHQGYEILADLMKSGALSVERDVDSALSGYETIIADPSAPKRVKDVARIRAAYLLADEGAYNDTLARLNGLEVQANALGFFAREAAGIAAYHAEDYEGAVIYFTEILTNFAAPPGLRQRAEILAGLANARVTEKAAMPEAPAAPEPVVAHEPGDEASATEKMGDAVSTEETTVGIENEAPQSEEQE